MSNNPAHDHHFVPAFYLRRWIVPPEQRLVEYRRRDGTHVRARWTGPKGTGYERHLYDAQDGSAASLEESFLKPADSKAAQAMDVLLMPSSSVKWESNQRSAWSRFVMTMLMRHPDDVSEFARLVDDDWLNLTDEMRHRYLQGREPGMPEVAEDWWAQQRDKHRESARLAWMRSLMDNQGIGQQINDMFWNVVRTERSENRLITSDRPVLSSKTLGGPDSFIVMPLTPTDLFVAGRRREVLDVVLNFRLDDLVLEINREVIANARRFVFASDRRHEALVREYFGIGQQPTWMMRLAAKRAHDRLTKAA